MRAYRNINPSKGSYFINVDGKILELVLVYEEAVSAPAVYEFDLGPTIP